MRNRILPLVILGQLALVGCGGSLPAADAPQPQQVALQESSSLKVTLQLDLPATEDSLQSSFPPNASSFVVEVLDPQTDSTLAGPVSLDRPAGQSLLTQTFDGLPRGNVRLLVTALDNKGARLGLADQAVALVGPQAEVTVSSLFLPGLTREVGRLSINQVNANGPSFQPTISSDGKLVVFASAATNLIPTAQLSPGTRIYRKDRVSGVVTFVSSGTADTSPDMSGDGRFVVYLESSRVFLRDLVAGRGSRSATPITVALGTGTLSIPAGAEPKISEDGNTVVYTTRDTGRADQIVVFDRPSGRGTLLTQSAQGQTGGGCSHPVMTPDARQIFFSTEGLAQGPAGLVVIDRSTGQATQLLSSGSAFPCAVSRDGTIVAVHDRDHRLLVINRTLGTTTEIPRPNAFAAAGAPSLSADGRFLSFCSGRSDLVSNDQNSQVDLFVLDRNRTLTSRINISNDQTAVQGGLIAALGGGPVISRDGSRIAFASDDSLLVPLDSNGVTDVFSAINPTLGKLYVASGSSILRFDNIATARGLQTPAATITSQSLGSISDVFLDVANDRLYVFAHNVLPPPFPDQLLLFENVSTLDGPVTPTRQRDDLPQNFASGLAVDVGRDKLYNGRFRTDIASSLGPGGLRILFPGVPFGAQPTALTLDTRRGLVFGATSRGIAQSSGELTSAFRPVLGGKPGALALDVSPAGVAGTNTANLMVLAEPGSGLSLNSLSRYSGNTDASLSPQQVISGLNTLLGPPPADTPGPLVIDGFTGNSYASSGVRIYVFPANGDGDIAPSRIIRTSADIRAMAIDRTR